MKLKYTLDDYINNPSGKGSAVNTMTADKSQYEKELMSLESRNAKTSFTVYQVRSGNKQTYYIHFLIPSSTKGFFNDVVFEFTQNPDDTAATRTIKHYNVRFFTNDMNFVYTYAYTFKSHGLLIDGLEKKLPFRSVVQKPGIRNPDNAMGYNKAIYFSYLVMERSDLFSKDTLNRLAKPSGIHTIASNIPDFTKKQQERSKIEQEAKMKGREGQPQATNKVIKSKGLLGNADPLDLKPKVTKVVNSVRNVTKASTVKKTKRK